MQVDPERAQDVFLAAVDQVDRAGRSALLDRECAGDVELRRRVESLLRANDESGGFLERPFVDPAAWTGVVDFEADGCVGEERKSAPNPDGFGTPTGDPMPGVIDQANGPAPMTEGPGDRIGPYKLLRKIGLGGMGVVYMAEQEAPVRRQVALKIIRPGMDSEAVVARFEAERQALALMDHPNIARVLDAGTTGTGRPYFVMELVHGEPITEYCDRGDLTTTDRLELFIPLCQAIQHAHQNGVIHRDIKPSNVLVTQYDGRPVAKVIDFGVAKAIERRLTERTLLTHHGLVLGTFEYMSPEQAEPNALGVDTRSDIYSLGVLLYELLTGSTPLDRQKMTGSAYSEILRRIREEEPPRPSARLKTMQLTLPAVSARRKTEPARLTKLKNRELDWIVMKALEKVRTRRYETASALGRDLRRLLDGEVVEACPPSAVYRLRRFAGRNRTALVTVGLIVLFLLAGVVLSILEVIRVTRAEARTRAEADKARRSAAEARSVLNFFKEHVLSTPRPEGMAGALGKDVTIRRALDAAEPKLASAFPGQPGVEAAVRTVLGDKYYYLGEPAVAVRHRERVLELRSAELGPGHPDTLKSRTDLALAYWAAGQVDRAIPMLERTVPEQSARLGPEHPDTLTSQNHLALLYQAASSFDRSIALLERTVQARRKVLGAEHSDTLLSQSYLANSYRVAGRLDRALPLIERTVHSLSSSLGADHPDTITARNTLANVHRDLGQYQRAVSIAEQTLEMGSPKLGIEHPRLQITLSLLAMCHQASGWVDRSVPLFERAVMIQSARLGPDHPEILSTQTRLASAHRDAGRYDLALPILEKAVPTMEAKLGPTNIRSLLAKSILADIYRCSGQWDRSIALLEGNLTDLSDKLGPDHAETLLAQDCLARAYYDAHRVEPAIRLWERNLERRTAKFGADHPGTLATRVDLAEALQMRGDVPGIEWTLRDLLAALRGKPEPHQPDVARTLTALARALMGSRNWPEAERLLVEALTILDERSTDHWTRFEAESLLGQSLLGQGRPEEAEPRLVAGFEGLIARQARIPAARRACLTEIGERTARLYEARGDPEKAEAWRARLPPPLPRSAP